MGKKRQSGFTKQGVRDLNTPTEKQQALQKTREQLLRGAQCPTCRGKGWRWAATWGWDGWEEVLSTLKFRHGKAVRDLVRNACTGPRGNAAERELCGIEAEDEEPEEAKMDAKTDEMQPASAELLPCPFCGSDAEVEPYPPGLEPVHSWQGECTVCAATGPSGTTAAHAAEGWNRYSDHDIFVQLRREVAALKGVPAHELELGPRWKRVGGEYRRDFGAGFGAPNSGVLAVRWDWNERPPDKWTVLLFSAVVSHECPEPQSNFATFNEAVQHCEAWLVEHQLEAKKEVQR